MKQDAARHSQDGTVGTIQKLKTVVGPFAWHFLLWHCLMVLAVFVIALHSRLFATCALMMPCWCSGMWLTMLTLPSLVASKLELSMWDTIGGLLASASVGICPGVGELVGQRVVFGPVQCPACSQILVDLDYEAGACEVDVVLNNMIRLLG